MKILGRRSNHLNRVNHWVTGRSLRELDRDRAAAGQGKRLVNCLEGRPGRSEDVKVIKNRRSVYRYVEHTPPRGRPVELCEFERHRVLARRGCNCVPE